MSWWFRDYIELEEDGYVVYAPEGYSLVRGVDVNRLVEVLKENPYVNDVKVKGKWIVADLSRKAGKVMRDIINYLKEKGFDVPVGVGGKYSIAIPKEFSTPYVELDVSTLIREEKKIDRPFCLVVRGKTYNVKDDLKNMGFTFKPLYRVWVRCFATPNEVMDGTENVIKRLADKIAVKVPKDFEERLSDLVQRMKNSVKFLIKELKKDLEAHERLAKFISEKIGEGVKDVEREYKVFVKKGLEGFMVCAKPVKYLPYDKFREIREKFKSAGGKYYPSLAAFCIPSSGTEVGVKERSELEHMKGQESVEEIKEKLAMYERLLKSI